MTPPPEWPAAPPACLPACLPAVFTTGGTARRRVAQRRRRRYICRTRFPCLLRCNQAIHPAPSPYCSDLKHHCPGTGGGAIQRRRVVQRHLAEGPNVQRQTAARQLPLISANKHPPF